MPEKNLETKARLLRCASTDVTGALHLSKELRLGPAGLISLLHEMQDEGLVKVGVVRSKSAGRPRTRVEVTLLGKDYLRAYDELVLKVLKSRKSDLRKASADAEYVGRLVERGVSPYLLFLELNDIARRIGRAAV